jgi:GTP-dependent phosphoenolpyruvate carboxykinase
VENQLYQHILDEKSKRNSYRSGYSGPAVCSKKCFDFINGSNVRLEAK